MFGPEYIPESGVGSDAISNGNCTILCLLLNAHDGAIASAPGPRVALKPLNPEYLSYGPLSAGFRRIPPDDGGRDAKPTPALPPSTLTSESALLLNLL